MRYLHRKVIIISLLFFVIEVISFVMFQDELFSGFPENLRGIERHFSSGQQQAFRVISEIQNKNRSGERAIYFFGGSVARSLFCDRYKICTDDDFRLVERETNEKAVNALIGSQTLIDVLRLVDNIQVEGSTVVITLYPRKFLASLDVHNLALSKYLYGAGYKYPVASPAADLMLEQWDVSRKSKKYRILASMNIYAYLMKDLIRYNFTDFDAREFLVVTEQDRKAFEALIANDAPLYKRTDLLEERVKRNLLILERIYLLAKQRELQLVLMDLPYSNTLQEHFGNEYKLYQAHLSKFMDEHSGIYHIRLDREQFDCSHELFHDGIHLLPEGRRYFSPYLKKGIGLLGGIAQR